MNSLEVYSQDCDIENGKESVKEYFERMKAKRLAEKEKELKQDF